MASWKKVIVSGSKAVLAEVTASAGFSGDGSNLTGITATSVNIDGLSALGGTGLHQTDDHFMFSDAGTEKKITFSNLQDAVFADVSGDATIAAGGALTIAGTSVENSMLANDGITIAGNDTSLGGSITAATILDGTAVVSGAAQVNSLINDTIAATIVAEIDAGEIAITKLAEDAITIGGAGAIDLGGTATVANILKGSTALSGSVANLLKGSTALSGSGNTGITTLGTISTGTWNGTAIASAYLDSDTAHLTTDQTFSGKKTFSAPVTASANISSSANVYADEFHGDGSNLTGVAASSFDIDSLSELDATPHATQDEYVVSDNGTEKRVSMTNVANGAFALVSGDATIAAGGALTIAADSVENTMLANITRGSVKVGGASDAPTDLDAKTSGQILVGDGTDIASVAVSGDISLASNGAVTIAANAVEGSMLNSNTAGTGLTYAGSNLDVDLSGESAITIGAASSTTTFGDDVVITGNLEIRGSHTAVSSSNLLVADQFALFNSGSTSGDGGIVVQTGASGVGTALAFDDSAVRWGVSEADGTSHSATSFTPRQYVVTVSSSAADPDTTPANFGNNQATRAGLMHVRTDTEEVWIYA